MEMLIGIEIIQTKFTNNRSHLDRWRGYRICLSIKATNLCSRINAGGICFRRYCPRKPRSAWQALRSRPMARALELCGLDKHFQKEEFHRGESICLDGLSTHIGPAGNNLSSGQMQLLCVARPVLQKPKILVIDEGRGVFVLFNASTNSH